MIPNDKPLISAGQIGEAVAGLGAAISRDYAGRELLVLVMLKGGLIFGADLVRHLTVPVILDFIRVRSYKGTSSTGHVEFIHLPEEPITGRHVLVIEDIADTGRSAAAVMRWVRGAQPASVSFCVLLDKPTRREVPMEPDYKAFTVDDQFVVGYGLDHNQRWRELPAIHVLEER